MLVQYTYIKPRHEFGKQCLFDDSGIVAEENVQPDEKYTKHYIERTHRDVGVQKSTQFALHEMETVSAPIKNTGMLHTEGGWPKEINPRDEEITSRFRRRVEKDDIWVPSMTDLLSKMERCINQNNALNIYENYFEDMVPTSLVLRNSLRIRNLYEDPRANVRPVCHLSWSPGGTNRLAASYSFMEFEVSQHNVNPYSYVWDIENPTKALITLKSSVPLTAIEFNPRDPSMLISGLVSGQVCYWDIRIGSEPVQISDPLFSHRNPANQALWITSKTNTEFFSSSVSGAIKWWDIRSLRKPTDTLVMDFEDPMRGDIVKAIGVSALQFEPSMGRKFMAGMQNGIVVNVNRKAMNAVEKLATTYKCYTGPVITIDRNPFLTKNFLTIGDWSAKIWADDTTEGRLLSTPCSENNALSGGCWSRARYSVFFTIDVEGVLMAYDILYGMKGPLVTIRICENSLTAISPHEDGHLLAVGGRNGNIYLMECSEGLTTNSKNDKAFLTAYLERCSRFEKATDNRLKEMRLMYGSIHDDHLLPRRVSKAKSKSKESRESTRSKEHEKKRMKSGEHERGKKKSRSRKLRRDTIDNGELAAVEAEYFRIIETESEKYTKMDDTDVEAGRKVLQALASKENEEEPEPEKDDPTKDQKVTKDKVKKRKRRPKSKALDKSREELQETEIDADIDSESLKSKGHGKKREGKFLKKACAIAVCKPEICCKDKEESLKAKRKLALKKALSHPQKEVVPSRTKAFFMKEKWYRKLSEYIDQIPERSALYKKKILRLKDAPPSVLREESKEAKKEVLACKEMVVTGKYRLEKPAQETVEIEEKKMDDESKVTIKSEEKHRISKSKERKQSVKVDAPLRKSPTGRKKGKKSKEEVKDPETMKIEQFMMLKDKIQQEERAAIENKDLYPRISAAFVVTEDVEESQKK